MLQVFLAEDTLNTCSVMLLLALKPACYCVMTFSACGLRLFMMSVTLLGWLLMLMVLWFWHSCKFPFYDKWLSPCGWPFSFFQILLQTELKTSIMSSLPAWSNSVGTLSTPADFPVLSALIHASIFSRTIWCSLSEICGQSSTFGSPSI